LKEQKDIEKVFQEAFENFEADPGKNAWGNIQSGLNSGAAAGAGATASGSSWISTAIVGLAISSIAVGGYLFFNKKAAESKEVTKTEQAIQEATENSNKETPLNSEEKGNTLSESTTAPKKEGNKEINERAESPTKQARPSNDKVIIPPISSSSSRVSNQPDSAKKINETDKTPSDFNDESLTNKGTSLNPKSQEKEQDTNEENKEDAVVNASSGSSLRDSNKVVPSPGSGGGNTRDPGDDVLPPAEGSVADGIFNPMPNTFTPNQDGTNDTYRISDENIEALRDKVDEITVRIYNLSGNMIHQWVGFYGEWDGRLKDGTLAPNLSIYIYTAVIRVGDEEIPYRGQITVRR
jgi:gliding motility-associated-like protein